MLALRPALLLLAAALAAIAVGCGADSGSDATFSGADAEVADVVADLEDAAQNEEPTRICRALVSEELAADDCAGKVEQAIDDTDQFSLDVEDVTVDGEEATARVVTGSGDAERTVTMRFVRQGTSWRISSFG